MSSVHMSTIIMLNVHIRSYLSAGPMSTIDMSIVPVSTIDMSTVPMSTIDMSTVPVSTIDMFTVLMSTFHMSIDCMSTINRYTISMSTGPMSTNSMSTVTCYMLHVDRSCVYHSHVDMHYIIPISTVDTFAIQMVYLHMSTVYMSIVCMFVCLAFPLKLKMSNLSQYIHNACIKYFL